MALTIAGSDSGGGAGIQADLRSFAANGVFGASAVTALTAQNTREVRSVLPVDPSFVDAQIGAVVDDLPVRAVKTGMLATTGVMAVVAARATAGDLPNLVVDPVLVASSGDRLFARDAEQAYLDQLFPLAAVITPNATEAEVLLGRPLPTVDARRQAAVDLGQWCPGTVVVKGGHPAGAGDDEGHDDAVDLVWDGQRIAELRAPWVETRNNHGTGCSFAATVAAGLASGEDVPAALRRAKAYVHGALVGAAGWHLGRGHGPVDHFF